MAENLDPIEIAGSQEAVALRLFYEVARAEGKDTAKTGGERADRRWVLDAYAECLLAVKSPAGRLAR